MSIEERTSLDVYPDGFEINGDVHNIDPESSLQSRWLNLVAPDREAYPEDVKRYMTDFLIPVINGILVMQNVQPDIDDDELLKAVHKAENIVEIGLMRKRLARAEN